MRKAKTVVGVLMVVAACGTNAAHAQTPFDFPGATDTEPNAISNNGQFIVGVTRNAGVVRGFERFTAGTFAPIVNPGDNSNFTRALGVNNSETIVGDYLHFDSNTNVSTFHGFLKNGGFFTQFDVAGSISTSIMSINDTGDFAGTYGSSVQPNQAFLDIGGTVTAFNVAGSTSTFGLGLNNVGSLVGQYTDIANVTHGYLLAGTSVTTIDVPGATFTTATGINDAGTITGYFADIGGQTHGFLDSAGVFTQFDIPGALDTNAFDTNNSGTTVGYYVDGTGALRGFVTTPEPGSSAMLAASALAGIGFVARRRQVRRPA